MNKTPTLAALTLALLSAHASAQVANGDFAAGLAGWNRAGDVAVQAGVLALTSAYYAGGTDDDAPYNLSGTDAIGIDALEIAAGVPNYALDIAGEAAYEGSIAHQSFTVAAGDTLSFDWAYATLEAGFQDHAFAVVGGQLVTLATRSTAPLGWQTWSQVFAQAGSVTLALGIADTGDYLGVSTLRIDNVGLTPAIPEPAAVLLMLAGLGVVGGLARRARRSADQTER